MHSPTTSPWGWSEAMRRAAAGGVAVAAVGLWLLAPGPEPEAVPGPPALVVDPNTAPPAVLSALPRMGPAMVARVVEARERAPFRSLDDLDARVRGLGPATLERLRPHLRIETDPTPP